MSGLSSTPADMTDRPGTRVSPCVAPITRLAPDLLGPWYVDREWGAPFDERLGELLAFLLEEAPRAADPPELP